jgi:hypothetical protein
MASELRRCGNFCRMHVEKSLSLVWRSVMVPRSLNPSVSSTPDEVVLVVVVE